MRSILLAIPLVLYAWSASGECSTWSILETRLARYGLMQDAQFRTGDTIMTVFICPIDGVWTLAQLTPQRCATILGQGTGWRWLFRKRASG